ncbi:MAG: DUF456 family protein [Deltaproteobacteria bacterium]|nr:DUF456 family protein [Deltaproteobacteria bacterium]
MIWSIILWVLALLLTVAGIVGIVVPMLPGAPMVFAGLFAAAWAEDFAFVGWRTLTVLGVMTLLTYLLDFAATAFGAERFGASGYAIAGATVGALGGLLFGLLGVLVGPFVGAVLGELISRRDPLQAGRAGIGATVGLALGAAAKLAVAFSMVGVFVVVRIWGAV